MAELRERDMQAVESVQTYVLQLVGEAGREYMISDLIDQVAEVHREFSREVIRDAVWSLADQRELTFTGDWNVSLCKRWNGK